MKRKMAYMTLNGAIPSRKANGVGVMNTCSEFAQRDLDVELILPRGHVGPPRRLLRGESIWDFYSVPRNFRVSYLPCPKFGSSLTNGVYSVLAMSYAALKCKDLIYSRHIELAYVAALYGKMSVFESHNYLKVSQRPILSDWIGMLRNPRRPVAMVVTTEAAARAYEAKGVPAERIRVAPNGVALKRFTFSGSKESMRKSIGLPIEKTVVGFSGHLYRGRGIERLLECAKLLDQVFFLIVGGEPADILRNKSFAQDLGLSNVKFAGFVPQANMPNYLFACDILVMPYTEATLTHNYMSPMKMFEYLATGRPIVATDFPVIREVLVDKRNSVLVPSNSADALAWGIKWIMEHPKDAKRLAEKARREAEQYSWENRVKCVISWFGDWFGL